MRYVEIYARNAFFSKETEDLFSEMQERAQNQFVKKYISTNLRKYYINDWNPGNSLHLKPITKVKESSPKWLKDALDRKDKVFEIHLPYSLFRERMFHLVDYLNTLPLRPISIPAKELKDKVKQWDKKLRDSKEKGLEIKEDGIEIIYEYPNKYKWVKVFGRDSLNREGKLMNHCVGGYYDYVQNDKCEIYSLRDEKGLPHVTIEYSQQEKTIQQVKGHSNSAPYKYMKFINHFLKNKIVPWQEVNKNELLRMGILYQDNKVYYLNKLPLGFVIKDGLDLSGTKIKKLSDNITIDGDLTLAWSSLEEFPNNLTINGSIVPFYNSKIKELPNNLTIHGSLYISSSLLITKIPQEITVGSLILNSCKITKIPSSLKNVKGLKIWESCGITELPDDLELNGNLDLVHSNIKVLPLTMKIHGKIKVIPENISNIKECRKVYQLLYG